MDMENFPGKSSKTVRSFPLLTSTPSTHIKRMKFFQKQWKLIQI